MPSTSHLPPTVAARPAFQRRPQRLVQPRRQRIDGVGRGVQPQARQVLHRPQPFAERGPAAVMAHQQHAFVQNRQDQSIRRRRRLPSARLPTHQIASGTARPVGAGRTLGQQPQRAVGRRCRLFDGRSADSRRLHQGVEPGQGLVQGDVFLHLARRQIGQAQAGGFIGAHGCISLLWRPVWPRGGPGRARRRSTAFKRPWRGDSGVRD